MHQGKIELAHMEVHNAMTHLSKALELFKESKEFDHEAYQAEIDKQKVQGKGLKDD